MQLSLVGRPIYHRQPRFSAATEAKPTVKPSPETILPEIKAIKADLRGDNRFRIHDGRRPSPTAFSQVSVAFITPQTHNQSWYPSGSNPQTYVALHITPITPTNGSPIAIRLDPETGRLVQPFRMFKPRDGQVPSSEPITMLPAVVLERMQEKPIEEAVAYQTAFEALRWVSHYAHTMTEGFSSSRSPDIESSAL